MSGVSHLGSAPGVGQVVASITCFRTVPRYHEPQPLSPPRLTAPMLMTPMSMVPGPELVVVPGARPLVAALPGCSLIPRAAPGRRYRGPPISIRIRNLFISWWAESADMLVWPFSRYLTVIVFTATSVLFTMLGRPLGKSSFYFGRNSYPPRQ